MHLFGMLVQLSNGGAEDLKLVVKDGVKLLLLLLQTYNQQSSSPFDTI